MAFHLTHCKSRSPHNGQGAWSDSPSLHTSHSICHSPPWLFCFSHTGHSQLPLGLCFSCSLCLEYSSLRYFHCLFFPLSLYVSITLLERCSWPPTSHPLFPLYSAILGLTSSYTTYSTTFLLTVYTQFPEYKLHESRDWFFLSHTAFWVLNVVPDT